LKRLVISRLAEDDLAGIYRFLATEYDLDAAERFRVRAEKALLQLARHAELGPRPAWSTRHKKLRFWVISKSNYIIYYESTKDEVSIERVLDGRRDVKRIIELRIEHPPENDG